MQGKAKERWIELCEQATVEHDANKLLKLIQEIDKLLREKQERMDCAESRTHWQRKLEMSERQNVFTCTKDIWTSIPTPIGSSSDALLCSKQEEWLRAKHPVLRRHPASSTGRCNTLLKFTGGSLKS